MSKKELRFGSVCSGIEAASVAWNPLGWKAAWFAEIDSFPSAVLAHRFPDIPNYGDMTKLPEMILNGEIEAPEMLCGGTPCFTAGQMVLTTKGYKVIESVEVGDLVVTHKGRLRPVLRIGNKIAQVGELEMVGHKAITCTPNHPFLSVNYAKKGNVKTFGVPQWVDAKDMPGLQWCSLVEHQEQEINIRSAKFADDPEKALLLAGMYVGDGYIRRFSGSSKKCVTLCLNDEKLAFFEKAFPNCGAYISKQRTAYKVNISDTAFAEWLVENFGELSHGKTIPSWLLGHKHRGMFALGYQITDGHTKGNLTQFATVSRSLAYGVCDLMNTLGYATGVNKIDVEPTKQIEGRTVNQSDWYQVRAWRESKKSRIGHDYLLRLVQNFEELSIPQMVYNIEVEEDNSYILDGAIVHNCQAFSVAGQRKSLDDDRGNLSLVFTEIADAIDNARFVQGRGPCIVFWENVPGVLSTKDNAFGCFLAGLVGANAPLESGTEGNKWPTVGYVAGPQRKVAWRTLDAQHHGVPQRRRRVFVIASARDDFDPSKVFFERQSMSGDSESSIEARQSSSPDLENGIGSTSQGLDVSLGSEKPVTPTVVAGYGKCYNDLKDGGCLAVHSEASAFSQSSFANYDESETTGTIRAAGGDLGGGSESLIIKKKRLESTTQE